MYVYYPGGSPYFFLISLRNDSMETWMKQPLIFYYWIPCALHW